MYYYIPLLLISWSQFQAVSSKCYGGQVPTSCVTGCTRDCNLGIRPLCKKPAVCLPGCECPPEKPITTKDENGLVKCVKTEDCCPGDLVPGCEPNACSPRCDPPEEPIACPAICKIGCQCPSSKPIQIYGRDGSLQCITKDKCPRCTGGQVYKLCGSSCTATCDQARPLCIDQCVTRCQCPPEAPIWHNGKCIPLDKCPKCEGGQVFMPCGSACVRTCSNPNPLCTKQCVPRCQCPTKAPLWDGENCFTQDECKDCLGGQVWNNCGSACTATCANTNPICTLQCVPRCQCPRIAPLWNGVKCIGKEMCPVCKGGQVFKTCGSACTPTCDVPNPICTEQCVMRCECPTGKPLWDGTKCIGKDECVKCPGGQEFRTCGSACTATCENPYPICILVCVARCQCPPQKPLWDGEKCITKGMCKNCPGGQVFESCGSACTPTCENPNPICTKQCVSRCECPDSKPLWDGFKCINKNMCPKCSGGRVYKICGSACTPTCDVPNPICTRQCVPRCQCPKEKPFWNGVQCLDKDDCECRLPADMGPCVIHTMRWYYNMQHMRCEQFAYGGCLGNANNFISEKDCHKKCDMSSCKYIDCSTSHCPAEVKLVNGCRNKKCQCDCPCKSVKCEKGYECIPVRNSNCKKPPCPFIGKCVEKVCKHGAPLTDASCGTYYKCPPGSHCKQTSNKQYVCCPDDRCQLPPDSGCGKRKKMFWYYDSLKQDCLKFRFGGDGGNKNRFISRDKCLKKCLPKGCEPLKCNIICEFGYKQDKYGCEVCECKNPCKDTKCGPNEVVQYRVFPCLIPPCPMGCVCEPSPCTLPKVPGPCRGSFPRYFFNSHSKQCQPFTYGGCGGNANNFESLEDCLRVCARFALCPIVDRCFTQCPHGFRQNSKGCFMCDCHDPCKDTCCPRGQVCQPLTANCVTSPCPQPVATCVPKKCRLGLPLQNGRSGDFCCTEKNKCPEGYSCEDGVCCAEDKCALPADSGPCTNYKTYYYLDFRTGFCKSFLFGGCGGNKNRFPSFNKCMSACDGKCLPVRCKLFCPDGYETDVNGCQICKCIKT